MSFECCRNCKPPKRHVGCHSKCEEYLEEKAKHQERKDYNFKHQSVVLSKCDFNKIGFANAKRKHKK